MPTDTPPNPLPCGCKADDVTIFDDDGEPVELRMVVYHCPLHVAAEQMLAALEKALARHHQAYAIRVKLTGINVGKLADEIAEMEAALAAARKEPTR